MLLTQAYNCRRQKKIISTLPLPLRITTSSLTQDIGNYVFVQSVEEYANQDIFGYWKKRNTSIIPTVLSTSLLEDWHDNGIFPVFGVSQICKTSLYKLEASITATMFPDFGSYTTPSKGFTFLSCTDGIHSFSNSGFPSTSVMFGLVAMVSTAERSTFPVMLSSWSNWFANLSRDSAFSCIFVSP